MSESAALIPATDPATTVGDGDPKKDEATAKKRRAGFISRLRGMFGGSGEDFEKRLKYLSKEEASVHARMKHRAHSSRKMARNIICLGVSLEVSTRSRSSTTDTFGPEGTVINADIQDPYKSVTNNSNVAGVTNNPANPEWDWDADDGALSNVEILLSEFGDFGDFFEDDDLTFGEPPGTAESQAVMHPVVDSEDLSDSPCTVGMDIQDQKFSPVGFSSLEVFNNSFAALTEDTRNSSVEITKDARTSGAGIHSSMPSAETLTYPVLKVLSCQIGALVHMYIMQRHLLLS